MMPTTTGNVPSQGLPDADFAGTSPAMEDLMEPGALEKLIQDSQQNPPPPSANEPTQEVVKTIDLGDGRGPQVFKGKSWEEVADKLATAQQHATAKIRELQNQGKGPDSKALFTPVEYKPRELSQTERLKIADQLANGDPMGFDALIEARFGAPPAAVANGLNAMQTLWRDKLEQNAASQWAQRHAGEYWQYDFVNSLARISKKLLDGGYPITENNLEWSYSQLVTAGELQVEEPAEEPPPPPPPPAQNPQRTAPPAFVVSDRSGQRSEPAQRRESVPNVAELNAMPLEKMRDAITARMKQGR